MTYSYGMISAVSFFSSLSNLVCWCETMRVRAYDIGYLDDIFGRCEEDARNQATEAGVSADVALERDPDVLDTWFRWGKVRVVFGGGEGVCLCWHIVIHKNNPRSGTEGAGGGQRRVDQVCRTKAGVGGSRKGLKKKHRLLRGVR